MNGILMNAFNTSEFNYLELALVNATLIHANMNCEVAVITDTGSLNYLYDQYTKSEIDSVFDHIIIVDVTHTQNKKLFRNGKKSSKVLQWNNMHQTSVFDLTPFAKTIVVDIDYLILDDSLNSCWNSTLPFMMNKEIDVFSSMQRFDGYDAISENGIDQYWSTCFYFDKSEKSKDIFTLVNHIKNNYKYYATLYNFSPAVYRNDYVFSIALHTLNGYTSTDQYAFHNKRLLFTSDFDYIHTVTQSGIIFALEYNDSSGEYFPLKIDTNVHAMNKYTIAENAKTIMEIKPCAAT